MEGNFKFIIKAESEEFENNYIMKYRCPCGGKYQIFLRERVSRDDAICNLVKTMCISCNRPEEFLFDITEREKNNEDKTTVLDKRDRLRNKRVPRRESPRSRDSSSMLTNVAREIEDAFISFNDLSGMPADILAMVEERETAPPEPSSVEMDDEGKNSIIKDYENLKFLYAQAMMKIRYLEEDNKSIQKLQDTLKNRYIELQGMKNTINNLQQTIDKLTEEIDDKSLEIDDLKLKLTSKDQEIESYKKLSEEKKQSGWKKLLGGI